MQTFQQWLFPKTVYSCVRMKVVVILKILIFVILLFTCQLAQARTIKVGIYDNPPKVSMRSNENPWGIFIDIIEYIADQEEWEIEYVPGKWETGMAKLEIGEIDLMPDVAYSEDRAKKYDFNKLAILSSWLQIFSRETVSIESINDVNGKIVVVLKGSIQEGICHDLQNRFNLKMDCVALPSYEETVKQVESGKADVLLCGRFYGYKYKLKDTLVPSPVILHPTTLHFATAKGRNANLLSAIDRHVAELKNDPNSVYYESLANWLHEPPERFVPSFVKWSIVSISLAFLVVFTINLFLRWKVKQQTRELRGKNEDLQNAINELQTARNEALKRERLHAFGQLAGGVAHDFNNILSPILGYAEIMLQDPKELEDKGQLVQNLGIIKTASERGVELVKRMKQFWRLSDEMEEEEMVSIREVAQEVIELAKARWKSHSFSGKEGIRVNVDINDASVILARKSELHEIFLNLVLNAADAMPDGGAIQILGEEMKDNVIITVTDTGIGMTEDEKRKCMEPFFTTKGDEGTGMGLSVVSNIISEYGGKIDIDTKPGKGTRFIITLPLRHRAK